MAESKTNPEDMVGHDWAMPTGHRMHYLRVGTGPPVLLIHGLAAYSYSWRFTLPALAPHFTGYAVDLLGMGDSERPSGLDVSPRSLAAGLVSFMQAHSSQPWTVIGSSHGGGVAMWIARLVQEAGFPLQKLVLVAPINPWSSHGRWLAPLAAHPWTAAIVRGSRFAYVPVRRMTFSRMYGDASRVTQEALAAYARPLRIRGTVPHCLALLKNWNRNVDELEEVMRRITTPTLVIWGTKDRLVYHSSAAKLISTLPHARLVTIEGAGHLPYEECPQEFNAATIEFMTAKI